MSIRATIVRIALTILLSWSATVELSGRAAQSGGSFAMRVDVDLIAVEVAVMGKDGNPVPNLKIENFEIFEDGKKQEILSFDEVEQDAGTPASKSAAIIEDDQHRGKTVLIHFKDGYNTPEILDNMRQASEKFVREHMGPQDMFAVIFGNELKVLANFTTDRADVLAAIERLSPTLAGGTDYVEMLRKMEQLNYSLAHIKGPKSVLIFTARAQQLSGMSTVRATYERTLASAQKANVTYYVLDSTTPRYTGADAGRPPSINAATGAPSSPYSSGQMDSYTYGTMLYPNSLTGLVSRTGGFFIPATSNFDNELAKLGRQISHYYILGFQSSNPKHTGAFRKLKIKANIKDLELRYRPGYQDRNPIDALASSRQEKMLLNALASPGSTARLPIAFRPLCFHDLPRNARVIIIGKIRTEKIPLRKSEGKFVTDLNVMGVAYAEDGSIAARFSETIALSFEKESELRDQNLAYRNHFILRPGKYRLKLAVSDESNNLGSAEQTIDIPVLPEQAFFGSSIVIVERASRLSDLVQNVQNQMMADTDPLIYLGSQIEPSVENKLPVGAAVPVLFRIYNLRGSPDQWVLLAKARLLDENGREFALDPMSLKKSVSAIGDGVAAVGLILPFQSLAPGKYQLVLDIAETASSSGARLQTDLEYVK